MIFSAYYDTCKNVKFQKRENIEMLSITYLLVVVVTLVNREEAIGEVTRVEGPRVDISAITREEQEVRYTLYLGNYKKLELVTCRC